MISLNFKVQWLNVASIFVKHWSRSVRNVSFALYSTPKSGDWANTKAFWFKYWPTFLSNYQGFTRTRSTMWFNEAQRLVYISVNLVTGSDHLIACSLLLPYLDQIKVIGNVSTFRDLCHSFGSPCDWSDQGPLLLTEMSWASTKFRAWIGNSPHPNKSDVTFWHSKPWIPGGGISLFTVVIH